MICPSSLLSSGLPPRFVQHITDAFRALECTESPLQALVKVFGAFVENRGVSDAAGMQRIFLLLIAANHAHTRLLPPAPPIAANPPLLVPSSSEWLLLAARERALAPLSTLDGTLIDAVIAKLDAAFSTQYTRSPTLPIIDYGLGELWAGISEKHENSPEFVVGQALGKLTRLGIEVLVSTRPTGSLLRPILLRSCTTWDQVSCARFDVALALTCSPVPDKLPLLSFLGQLDVRTRLVEAADVWGDLAIQGAEGADLVRDFVQSMRSALTQKLDSLRFFGFAKPPALGAELNRTIALAVDALRDDPELRESWEVQRWGGPFPNTCIGKFFPMGLCTLALAEASVDPEPRVQKLLSMCGVDGFRYFEGYSGIAPDADDLGLALQLIARIPNSAAHVEVLAWPIEVLVRNTLPDGEIPVWLDRHLREPVAQGGPQWLGARCLAVAANAVIGLLEARVPLPAGYLDRTIDWITRTWRADGIRAVFFYGLSYARFVLVRLADVAEGRTEDPAIYQKLRDIARGIEEEIGASVEDDGGFGGIIDTACHLAALACGRRELFDPWPSIAFLASRQDHDGLWAAEPLYPTPGKDYAAGAHGARTITTALCLYALARTRRRIAL